MDYWSLALYAAPLAAVGWFAARRRRLEHRSAASLAEAREAGLTDPASLHPIIDPAKCVGCGACVMACPEQPEHHVLGLIRGKAALVGPTDCIGHGACKIACPMGAIELVFGTASRGVDIPMVSPEFETSVQGIYVAGELGGMGLIRNALEQGRQAVEAIHRARPRGGGTMDLVIVGAGPAGFGASITAKHHGLRFVTLEQDSLGGCVFQYPRGKLVMTQPVTLPIVGRIRISTTSKEDLLEFWRGVEQRVELPIQYQERVESIERHGDHFLVRTARAVYPARTVLLAIGRRGTPRKLGVPGEELPKVVYHLIDPEQYAGQRVVVVGGGDSALESAAMLAEGRAASVVLSYRGDAFGRAKARNRTRVMEAERTGRLRVLLKSRVRRIDARSLELDVDGVSQTLDNDAVIVNAGGVLPDEFLRQAGIAVETKWGTA
ncbi:MAG: NAD(P)-binding domain-containing protein [Steroidobacteraceae bacterium]